jgi:hypothetical protein
MCTLFLFEDFVQQVNIIAFLLAVVILFAFYVHYKKYEQEVLCQQMVDHLFEDSSFQNP